MADVSVRALIMQLMRQLKEEMGLTYLFITHDLATAKYLCDRVAIMYLGRIVELATRDELFAHPHHPYTKALLAAVPIPDPGRAQAQEPARRRDPERHRPARPAAISTRAAPTRCPHARWPGRRSKDVGAGHLSACILE